MSALDRGRSDAGAGEQPASAPAPRLLDPDGPPPSVEDHVAPEACRSLELVYVGHIAAPGYGVAYRCPVCSHPFVRVGGVDYDATEHVFELSPEDVR